MPDGSRVNQHGSDVHGAQTNIAGDVQGPIFSGQFNGDVIYSPDVGITKSVPRQSMISEKIQYKKLEKIKELEEKSLICHEAACMLQVETSRDLLRLEFEDDSNKRYD